MGRLHNIGHAIVRKPCELVRRTLAFMTLLAIFSYQHLRAQETDSLSVPEPQIMVMARPMGDGTIKLRWAVTQSRAWRKLNTYGYELKRYTITSGKNLMEQPVEVSLGIFKPRPLEDWMPLIEQNDHAAIMAQSLYGEGFEVEGGDGLSAIINLAEEQEQRFTWGLHAADQDYLTAEMAGLAYTDTSAEPEKKYLYKLLPLVPSEVLPIKEGGVFIGLGDREELSRPKDLAGVFLDGKAMLGWNHTIHQDTYTGYFIERSQDGSNFERLNQLPFTRVASKTKDSRPMAYMDSITNGTTYHYRVLGKTIFGETGPPSEVVSGKGEAQLAYTPKITTKRILDGKRVLLQWEFLEEGNPYIKGFEVDRAATANGAYSTVIRDIPPTVREIRCDSLGPTNYFRITALGTNGSRRSSFPALVQPVDSIPPKRPEGFKGAIDSLGIVTLTWTPNTEEDLLGYRVFRGNSKEEEPSQLTVSPHQGATFYDSIPLKTLNSKVYYTLLAVDQRFNQSAPSEVLEVQKPDLIKPTQPVFKAYKIGDGKVSITWAKSSSSDVVRHELYRKEKDSVNWKLVFSAEVGRGQGAVGGGEDVGGSAQNAVGSREYAVSSGQGGVGHGMEMSWTDEDVAPGRQYRYTLVAVDGSDLESDPAPPLTVTIPKTSLHPPVKGLASYVDRKNGFIELFWKSYDLDHVAELIIYKGLKDQPMQLLQHVLPTINRIVDEKVKPSNEYRYMIRAVFKDGSMGEVETLNVRF